MHPSSRVQANTTEMAQWLASVGNEVRVITAPPYYPAWKVSDAYSAWRYHRESIDGVDVFRTPLWVPSQPTGLKRLLHLASFAISSLPVLVMQWGWKPDVVWLVEPPLMCAPAALAFAHLRGVGSWLHVQDYEVDDAFSLGLVKDVRLRPWVQMTERWLMRRFDRVSSISWRIVERAKAKGVAPQQVIHFPNWVDISNITPLANQSVYRVELGLAADALVALYSGNMGNKLLGFVQQLAHLGLPDPVGEHTPGAQAGQGQRDER